MYQPWVPVALLAALVLPILPASALEPLKPTDGLPLKTHIYTDSACARSQTHLYYIPDGFCIGPLYAPARSIRLANAVPANCTLTAYGDGRCRTSPVAMYGSEAVSLRGRVVRRQHQVVMGPTSLNSCFGVGEHVEEATASGANSFFLECGK